MPASRTYSLAEIAAASFLDRMRAKLNVLFFDLDNPWGRNFNLLIIFVVSGSVLASMAGTIEGLSPHWHKWISRLDYWVTGAFALEYILRASCARYPRKYLLSFYGLVDLLAILPLLFLGSPILAMRLVRMLRLLKLVRYLKAMRLFIAGMRDSMEILIMVIGSISLGAVLAGNLAHALEPETFQDAFAGAWWSIVTMSTVGYGDYVPTSFGVRILAIGLMGMGIALFAMVTATVSIKMARVVGAKHRCDQCRRNYSEDFHYCPHCGEPQAIRKD